MERKQIKKDISRLWREVSGAIRAGIPPDGKEGQKLLAACEAYRPFVEKPWQEDWLCCRQALANCLRAAAVGDLAEALVFAAEADRLAAVCHAKYKL